MHEFAKLNPEKCKQKAKARFDQNCNKMNFAKEFFFTEQNIGIKNNGRTRGNREFGGDGSL